MAHETATLAAYVANLKFSDIPAEVAERAKVLTLDFLGSAIRARSEAYGIEVQYATPDSVDLPAYAGSTNLRYGRATATPQPSAAP